MTANSRTTSTRKTTASRPARAPRELAPPAREAVDDIDDELDAADAQEAEATSKHITVALCGEGMRVVPAGTWPVSAQRALRQGDFDGFMAAVLHEDDYELYEELDPTLDEINLFIEDAGNLSGEPQGKSRGPNRSSRRTRRR
ncbi:hypothetical protein OG298_45530 (plasmid) [Streptomyces sp. NBC_01005]|uniref:hypothetical protein n=1 Tax=unclassified Streptomyces TaxID=2593676 RepID=UPI002F90D2AC|nr:hypothetical protein OG298_45530 [Streptomyces sp. NBC_01005]